MTTKNELLISVVNWIEHSDTERDGTVSCGLPTPEKDFYKAYCTPDLACDSCPFWITPEMETLCDMVLEYTK